MADGGALLVQEFFTSEFSKDGMKMIARGMNKKFWVVLRIKNPCELTCMSKTITYIGKTEVWEVFCPYPNICLSPRSRLNFYITELKNS